MLALIKKDEILNGHLYETLIVVEHNGEFRYDYCPVDKIDLFLKLIEDKYKGSITRVFYRLNDPAIKLKFEAQKTKILLSPQVKLIEQVNPYQVAIYPNEKKVRIGAVSKKKKILIVDDSDTIQNILHSIIKDMDEFTIIGQITDPREVDAFLKHNTPDLVTLDIQMPYMNGIELLKRFFIPQNIPTIMISALSKTDGPEVMNALSLGAADYLQKPSFDQLKTLKYDLYEKISQIVYNFKPKNLGTNIFKISSTEKVKTIATDAFIAIGSSTGGTQALQDILTTLPSEIPPIVITQHIPEHFSKAFADRVNELCPFTVKEAEHEEIIQHNYVYVAPGGKHMKFKDLQGKVQIIITDDEPVNRFRPSVDYMMNSVADLLKTKVYLPDQVIGIILTGMGKDGAEGLLSLKNLGVRTIAQDESTSVVFGMPKQAIEIGAASFIEPLHLISTKIASLLEKNR